MGFGLFMRSTIMARLALSALFRHDYKAPFAKRSTPRRYRYSYAHREPDGTSLRQFKRALSRGWRPITFNQDETKLRHIHPRHMRPV